MRTPTKANNIAKQTNKSSAQEKAQKHFANDSAPLSFKDEMERERVERSAKTAKLRALRLAKEAEDLKNAPVVAPKTAKKRVAKKAAKEE